MADQDQNQANSGGNPPAGGAPTPPPAQGGGHPPTPPVPPAGGAPVPPPAHVQHPPAPAGGHPPVPPAGGAPVPPPAHVQHPPAPVGGYPPVPPAGGTPVPPPAYAQHPPAGAYPPPGTPAGGFPPVGGGAPIPGGAFPPAGGGAGAPIPPPPPEDTTPANFQLGAKLPAQLGVPVPKHELNFDQNNFLRLLAGSISLAKDEKKKIIESLPKLKQSQVDELIRIFEEEKEKFSALSKKHVPQLEKLAQQHYNEWMDLEGEYQQASKSEEDTSKADEIRKNLGLGSIRTK
ncbi:hypothetical protein JKY72_03730 [Candidatus Gracilibacteria bacterium]|nr:hypothetical protein [Candidatus Gracilibacteria bacterium]